MSCNKNKIRSFHNLFEILTCDNCNNEYNYSYIYIGNNIINIYIINNECNNTIKKEKMTNLFFKECIINNNDIFIVLEKNEYYQTFDYFPILLEFNCDLYVLIL